MEEITKDMTIEEIFEKFPQKSQKIAQELSNLGLNCVGCSAATFETLEMGVLSHGLTENDLQDLLIRLKNILVQEVDLSTITFTKRAALKFASILENDQKSGYGLRFGDKPGGCNGYEYTLDFSPKPLEDDEVFLSHDVEIHVSNHMVDRLRGCEIDYQDGLQGSGFKISNPNAKGSCSCGQSQSY